MFVYAKANIRLPSADGSRAHVVPSGFVGEIPDWAAKTKYFDALVRDGKIALPASHADKDVQPEADKPARRRRVKED